MYPGGASYETVRRNMEATSQFDSDTQSAYLTRYTLRGLSVTISVLLKVIDSHDGLSIHTAVVVVDEKNVCMKNVPERYRMAWSAKKTRSPDMHNTVRT